MRRVLDRALPIFFGACALVAVATLVVLIAAITLRGLPAIGWDFLSREMSAGGAGGGILYNVVGTALLMTTAIATAVPLAVGLALMGTVYLERGRRTLRLMLHLVNGVPSILFGIFGLIVFVKFLGWGKSWLSGGILLGWMILPTVTVSLMERIERLPSRYVEAAAGLGLTRSQVIWSVILPQSANGLVTGTLLGLARAAGETAPIMFTATIFSGATLPTGIRESPVLSLPYHIFVLAQDSIDPATTPRVWATAVVLLGLVFLLAMVALPLRLRAHEEARNG
jgi:phosphate transport system permease protein